jgi:hypothetical protein
LPACQRTEAAGGSGLKKTIAYFDDLLRRNVGPAAVGAKV